MKRFCWVSIFISLICFSSSAWADDVAELHQGKQFYVGFSPVSLFSFASYNQPVSLGYLVGPRILAGVSTGSSRDAFHRSGIQYNSKESSVWARYFMLKHLDLMARVRSLELDFSRRHTSYTTGLSVDYAGKLKAQTVGLGIGNRWVWENGLSVGADWLVANGIFGSSSSSSIVKNEGVPTAEAQLAMKTGAATAERFAGLPSVAVFSVGYVF